MSVFRVQKNKNYTVMSNYHLREKEMSLKAKGLLSLMLSLPEDWDYSIQGLVSICKENETAIKSALEELKKFGYLYIEKQPPTNENGGRLDYIYNIYEYPHRQIKEKQDSDFLPLEILPIENQVQLNTKELNTKNKINIKEIYKEKNDNAKIIEKPKERKNKKKEKIFNLLEKHYEEYGIGNEIVIEKLEKFFSNMLDDNRMITEDMIIATLTSLAKVSPDTQIKAIQLSLDKGYKSISPDYLNSLQGKFKPNNTYHNSNEVVQSQSDYNKQLDEYKNKNLKTF